MSLKLNAPGGGSVTLQEPTTASNVTLNLPAETGTVIYSNASGNVGIGVTPSAWGSGGNVEISNNGIFAGAGPVVNYSANAFFDTAWKYKTTAAASYFRQANGAFNFFIAPSGTAGTPITFTQAMTLDSSGNFMVGTTSPVGQFTSTVSTGPGASVSGVNTSTTYNGDGIITVRAARTTTNSSFFAIGYWNTGVSNYRFYVNDAGAVFSTSTSITAISDATLKENVRDLETGLPEVMALKPRRFDWKNGDAQNVAGFVAQEVEEVLPELVADYGYSKDDDDNIITKKSLKMGDILPTLVKAIQEQQAMIEELKAKVAALEAK